MRFVSPETVRIELDNGDWIKVKKELTVGDDKKYHSAGFRRVSGGENERGIEIDWNAMAFARVETYLVGWSADGVKVTSDAIRTLAKEDFDRIDAAIVRHIDAMEEERKNAPTPMPSTTQTSAS